MRRITSDTCLGGMRFVRSYGATIVGAARRLSRSSESEARPGSTLAAVGVASTGVQPSLHSCTPDGSGAAAAAAAARWGNATWQSRTLP